MVATVSGPVSFGGSSPSATTTTTKASSNPEPPKMRSLSGVSATSSSPAFADDYSRFQETFGSYEKPSRDQENVDEEEEEDAQDSSSTFFDLFVSLYLPVALLWLRRGMLGTANLIRSLVLGHCLRFIFGGLAGWVSDKSPSWLQTLVLQPSLYHHPHGVGVGKVDYQAWPPPAFTALALLTVFALVVHPDGFTWVMLGKLREVMLSSFQSSSQCWGIIIRDYGVIPTAAAATTLAALAFLLFVVVRTLTPKKRASAPTEKKKKKRKGQARQRGARIKSGGSRPSSPSKSAPSSPFKPSLERTPGLTPLSPASSAPVVDSTLPNVPDREEERFDASSTLETINDTSLLPNKSKSNEKGKSRLRVSSVSTLDTSVMSDDLSCGSTSIRSTPSVSVGSSKSTRSSGDQETASSQNNKKSNSSQRRHNRGGGRSNKVSPAPKTNDVVASSRWDALKPSHNLHHQSHQNNQNNDPHHRGNSNNNSNTSNKGRRGGGYKKGRPRNQAKTDSFFSRNQNQSSYSKNRQDRSGARSPVPPPLLNNTMNPNPSATASLPPPPPGLGPLPVRPCTQEPMNSNEAPSLLLPSLGIQTQQPSPDLSFLNSPQNHWNSASPGASSNTASQPYVSSPARFNQFHNGSQTPFAGSIHYGTTVKENPFAPEESTRESQIEADLQELGGQMAGSILDF